MKHPNLTMFRIRHKLEWNLRSTAEGSQFLEHRAHDTLWHRRAEDGKVECLLVPAPIRQLEDQVREIMKLMKRCKEEIGASVEDFSSEEAGSISFSG
jgi:hypothetical protein